MVSPPFNSSLLSSGSSPGLLPTPGSPPFISKTANDYVLSSSFPVPYPVVLLLDGCNISSLFTWNISVSSKLVKLKSEWLLSSTPSGSSFTNTFPPNILKSLTCYNLTNPTWNSSCSQNKLSLHLEWRINTNPVKPFHTPPTQITPTSGPKHPSHFISQPFLDDSGYSSFSSPNLPSGSRQQHVSRHDSSSKKVPPHLNFVSPVNSPALPHRRSSHPSKSTSPTNLSTCSPNYHKTTIISPSKLSPPDRCEIVQPSPRVSLDTVSSTDLSSHLTVPIAVSSSPASSSAVISASNGPKYVSDPDDVDLRENIFLTPPLPLPIDAEGYIDHDDVECLDILGICRLCGVEVPAFLIDNHILCCDNINENFIHETVDELCNEFYFDDGQITNAMHTLTQFKLTEHDIPNDTFKSKDIYFNFVRSTESLIESLFSEASSFLKLPSLSDHIHLLKFSND